MKEKEVPQENSEKFNYKFSVLEYALDEEGKFTTVKSVGWEPKNTVMENAWAFENEKIDEARDLVKAGKKSPPYFHMYRTLMDLTVLSGYTGFSRIKILFHFMPGIYKKLKPTTLKKYADAFNMETIEELNNLNLQPAYRITHEQLK